MVSRPGVSGQAIQKPSGMATIATRIPCDLKQDAIAALRMAPATNQQRTGFLTLVAKSNPTTARFNTTEYRISAVMVFLCIIKPGYMATKMIGQREYGFRVTLWAVRASAIIRVAHATSCNMT